MLDSCFKVLVVMYYQERLALAQIDVKDGLCAWESSSYESINHLRWKRMCALSDALHELAAGQSSATKLWYKAARTTHYKMCDSMKTIYRLKADIAEAPIHKAKLIEELVKEQEGLKDFPKAFKGYEDACEKIQDAQNNDLITFANTGDLAYDINHNATLVSHAKENNLWWDLNSIEIK